MPGPRIAEEARREDILRAAYDVAARHGVEALTLRAVAERAAVSHGTVVFHFERRHQLVATLLDRVLYATSVLRVPDSVNSLARPSERMLALLRTEMDRLAAEPRHFRLFLEYWAIGVRNLTIRRKVSAALESYRGGFREFASPMVDARAEPGAKRRAASNGVEAPTPDGLAAVAVSLVHGCALQAVIDPKRFDIEQHFGTAARLIRELG